MFLTVQKLKGLGCQFKIEHITFFFFLSLTVSAILQPRGSIFQYGFLGGGQYKKSLKKWTFWAKSGGLLRKTPKNWTLHITWGSIEEWGSIDADTYCIFIFMHVCAINDLLNAHLICIFLRENYAFFWVPPFFKRPLPKCQT